MSPRPHLSPDNSYILIDESTVNETVPLFMDEGEESATLSVADKYEDPSSLAVVEGPQPPTNNVEKQPGWSIVEEELQSERRKMQAAKTKLLS